jgi:hypothetical protein
VPSIKDLFGPDTGDDFDLDDFMAAADAAATESVTSQGSLEAPIEPETEPPPAASPEATTVPSPSSEAEATGEGEPGAGEASVPIAAPVAGPPSDPFQSLPADRRATLLALDQFMAETPGAVEKVFEAIKPPPPRPVPTLPEHVDPDSVEAQIWSQNQEILGRLDRQDAERQQATAREAQSQKFLAAAATAGNNFSARYPDLTEQEVVALARRAGDSGLAPALANRPGVDLTASYEEALEHMLWTDPTLRQRVAGVPSSNAAPPAPATGPTPAGERNKRVLHALSGAAVPIAGPPPAKAELETRLDGTLTPGSKGRLVDQLAADLRNSGYK